MIWYSNLVNRCKKHVVLYSLFTAYFFIGIIFYYLLSHQSYGITNLVSDPYRLTGWLFSISMDLYPTFILGALWAYINSISTPEFAKKSYGIITAFVKAGGIVASLLSILLIYKNQDSTLIPILVLLASLTLIISIFFVSKISKDIPEKYLSGYNIDSKEKHPHKTKPKLFEGFKLMLTRPYVFGIFLMYYFYDAIFTGIEYQAMKTLSDATQNYAIKMSSTLFVCMLSSQIIGLLLALVVTPFILKKMSMKYSLIVMPIVVALSIYTAFTYPTLQIMLIVITLLPAFHYGINTPLREVLFIPTIKEIQFKSKLWIDSLGRALSKSSGSVANILSISPTTILIFGPLLLPSLLATSVGWSAIAYLMGKKYNTVISNKEVIQ